MIRLLFATSPVVWKIVILLEELGEDYEMIPTDIFKRSHFDSGKMFGTKTNKLPVIQDNAPAGGGEPVIIFESGAILQYLAEKNGRFIPSDIHGRAETMAWLFWQVSGLGPFSGQAWHFRALIKAIEPGLDNSYSEGRYEKILNAHWDVMEERLADRPFLAGDDYGIADIACWPWIDYLAPLVSSAQQAVKGIDRWFVQPPIRAAITERYPNIARWHEAIADRPAVQSAYRRSSELDMGYPRNAMGVTMAPPEGRKNLIITGPLPSET
jgi:GST-like protein